MRLSKPNPYASSPPKNPTSEDFNPSFMSKVHTTPMSENMNSTPMTQAYVSQATFEGKIITTPTLQPQKLYPHFQEDLITRSTYPVPNLRSSLPEDVVTRPRPPRTHSLRSRFHEDTISGHTLQETSHSNFPPHIIPKPPPLVHNPHSSSSFQYHDDSTPSLTPNRSSSATSYVEKVRELERDETSSEIRIDDLSKLVSQVDEKPSFSDPDGIMLKKSKKLMTFVKILVMSTLLGFNAFMIWASWWWPHLFFIFLPFITFGVAVNDAVVVSLVLWKIKHMIWPERKNPASPKDESLILIVPCYNESEQELRQSLDSLVNQKLIEDHPTGIVIVCDGRVRGPGMTQTAADCLLHTILTERSLRVTMRKAYMGWDKQPSDIILQKGVYKGVPYLCIIKLENAGKRDSLILARSFAYTFNRRREMPSTILSPRLFAEMASFFLEDCSMDNIFAIVGLDADTILDQNCVYELMEELRYPKTIGVCGVVDVDFSAGSWNVWRLMQNAAYTVSQGLPRLHQSTVTKKVTCLPGCCQVLKVCEETCSDEILREKFGYYPSPKDSILKHLRANYSEDRNHVVNVLTSRPYVQTRQALKARAYTDVPTSLSVFLSQRKRWSLGATTNDFFLLTTRGTQWFERIRALANVGTWFVNIFILGCIAGLIFHARHTPWHITLSFLAAVILLYLYMFSLTFWFPPTPKAKLQYLVGLCIYMVTGPFLTITVLLYALYHLDHFSWGKTRQVILDDEETAVNNQRTVSSVGSSITLEVTQEPVQVQVLDQVPPGPPPLTLNRIST